MYHQNRRSLGQASADRRPTYTKPTLTITLTFSVLSFAGAANLKG